jgi:hypothetical protein
MQSHHYGVGILRQFERGGVIGWGSHDIMNPGPHVMFHK